MPVGYLVTVALVGICTVAALVTTPRVSTKRFALAVVVNEIPHLAAAWLVVATVIAWESGDLHSVAGRALAVVAGVLVVALAVLTRRCLRAGPVVEAAVGEHWVGPRRSRGRLVRPLLFPFPWRPRSVRRIGGVAYGSAPRQRLDVYRSRDDDVHGPVLVYFHGGGYSAGGNRREGRAMLHRLAAEGWVCLSATYRLRPRADFPDHLADARAALRWAHERADVHGGDTSTVVMAGSSAGGHLTALCALTQDPSDPDRPRVDAAVSWYAYYGRYYGRGPDEFPVSTGLALDPSAAPPFFLAHGDHDSYVPVTDARALRDHLTAGSPNTVWYVELPGAQHGFDALASWRNLAVIDGVQAFLDRVVTARQTPRPWGRGETGGCHTARARADVERGQTWTPSGGSSSSWPWPERGSASSPRSTTARVGTSVTSDADPRGV